jgi:hypothetical protein
MGSPVSMGSFLLEYFCPKESTTLPPTSLLTKQLVRELELLIILLELIQWHPGSFTWCMSLPFHHQLPRIGSRTCPNHLFRLWNGPTAHNWWQRRQGQWRGALVLLQEGDMEHVVDACPHRQLQPVRDRPNPLHHLIHPTEFRR